jgi:N-formylglutamate deformylase
MVEIFSLTTGSAPILISFPHVGTEIPNALAARMTDAGRAIGDTDWYLPRLYNFAQALGASTIVARFSRYVIDLNRPPEDANLYPGQEATGLVPLDTFGKERIYLPDAAPDAEEIAVRRANFWLPYHAALVAELARIKQQHGWALLWDAHSIVSCVPRFFSGKLPDLNLGTADGESCGAAIQAAVEDSLRAQSDFNWVVNGRFKGGYITRRYGRPAQRIHALQLEMCCRTYMEEAPPWRFDDARANGVRPVLQACVQSALAAAAKVR